MNPLLHLRLMTEGDLPFADSLRAVVGWNQKPHDWQRLLAYEPQGCFVAEWNGSPVGTATTTRYANEVAWIGMLLVHPDHRGRGVGRALLERCLQSLRGTRCIKLDATPLGKELYVKLGFQAEWPLTRWETQCLDVHGDSPALAAEAGGQSPAAAGPLETVCHPASSTFQGGLRLRPWKVTDASRIEPLDSGVFGVPRTRMLELLATQSSNAIVSTDEAGRVNGYGLLRQGSRAFYLGPVAASSSEAGVTLIRTLVHQVKGHPVFWDIPDANQAAVSLVKELGFTPQRPLLRMFIGNNEHPGNQERYYALADPSIG